MGVPTVAHMSVAPAAGVAAASRTGRRPLALVAVAAVAVLAVMVLGVRAVTELRTAAHPAPVRTTSDSIVASRLYEEGVRALYQFDPQDANRLFRAALRTDSTSPMATYFAWRAAVAVAD